MKNELVEVQPKIAALLASEYDFEVLIMAAILTAKDDQASLYLIAGFRKQADQLIEAQTTAQALAKVLGKVKK